MGHENIHQNERVMWVGRPIDEAQYAMVMLHGRGGSAEDILQLAEKFLHPDFAYVAPQAAGNTWYPYSFLEPIDRNEPYLTSALKSVDEVINYIVQKGIPKSRIMLLGFSQGACLTLEYAARHPLRYGGLVGLSGGLIGQDVAESKRYHHPQQSFDVTPVFLGCSDPDPHIPRSRVELTEEILKELGASVITRIYPNMGHIVNTEEVQYVQGMVNSLVTSFSN
jgi:predicted esterase